MGRLGGPQSAYRLSSLRQALQLDFIPTNDKVSDFAKALHAEAEQLALASTSSMSTTAASLQDLLPGHQGPAVLPGPGHLPSCLWPVWPIMWMRHCEVGKKVVT